MERQLAEALPSDPDAQRGHVPDGRHDPDGEAALDDEMQRVARLAALDVYYGRAKAQLEQDYNSARAVLLGMRSTRLVTPLPMAVRIGLC